MVECRKTRTGITICQKLGKPRAPYFYDKGRRLCSRCARTFLTTDRFCPCCRFQLRIHPRGRKGKEDLNERTNNEPTRYE